MFVPFGKNWLLFYYKIWSHYYSHKFNKKFQSFSHLSISSRLVNDSDELLDLGDGRPREILHRDEVPFQLRKCVMRWQLVGGERHQMIDSLGDQEPKLK